MPDDISMNAAEAEMIRDAARNFVTHESPISVVRAAENGDWTEARKSWQKLAALGWLELLQDEEEQDQGLIASCLIAEQLGRGAYSMPFVEAATLVLPLLAKSGAAQASMDALNLGAQRAVFAMPASGLAAKQEVLPKWGGEQILVAGHLQGADILLLAALHLGKPTLVIVTKPGAGWTGKLMADISDNAYCVVAPADMTNAELIPVSWDALSEAFDHFRLATAAYSVGLAARAVDDAIAYAKERIAFDKPIGSFQAVQHRLAEAVLELAGARLLIQEASACGDLRYVPMACMQTCEAATKASFTAQQIWAGMGYSMEVDVQLFFRRVRANLSLLGHPWELRHRIWKEFVPH